MSLPAANSGLSFLCRLQSYFRLEFAFRGAFLLLWLLFPLLGFEKSIIRQNQNSTVQIPSQYYFKEMAKSLNRHFQIDNKGVMCEDNSYTNNNNDNLKVVCNQLSDIEIYGDGEQVITEVKVRVNIEVLLEYEINIDLWVVDFDHVITLERELDFDIFVKFFTTMSIDQDLITQSQTYWEFEWVTLPFISFGPISFRVLDFTQPKVEAKLKEYAEEIDQVLIEHVNINKILYEVWEKFEKPIELSREFNLWNFFRLQEIRAGGVLVDQEKFTFPFKIDFKNYTGFGSNLIDNNFELWQNVVPAGFYRSSLNFTNKNFYMRIPLKLTVSDMEKLILEDITRKEYVFGTGNLKLKVTEVYLSIDKNFVVAQVFLRSVSTDNSLGNLVLKISFNPFYNTISKKLRARYLTYEIVRSDTVLIDIVNAIQKQSFTRILQDTIVLEFDSYVDFIHKLLNEKLENYAFNEQLLFRMVIDDINVRNVFIRGKEIYIIVDAEGSLELFLRNLF